MHSEARTDSADLNDIQPTEYRADLVVTLLNEGQPVMGVIVEAQLARDDRKQFVWPAYAATLRARLKCPVCLMVVTLDDSVAHWADRPIELGPRNTFTPLVLGPANIAKVTDAAEACKSPELAVLSAMAHGRRADTATAVKIARAALQGCAGLEADKARLYSDAILASLSEAARQEVTKMDIIKNWEPMSDWARGHKAEGRAEGVAEGRAEIVRTQLTARFGTLGSDAESRIKTASPDELEAIGVRLLTAATLEQALAES